jgi:hypothetical protein
MNTQPKNTPNYDPLAAHTAAAREYGRLKAQAFIAAAKAEALKKIADRLAAEQARKTD